MSKKQQIETEAKPPEGGAPPAGETAGETVAPPPESDAPEAGAAPGGKKGKAAPEPFPGFAGETPKQADKRLAKERAPADHRSAAPDSKNPPKGFVRVRMKGAIAGVNFAYKPKDEPWLHPDEAARWAKADLCDIVETAQ